MKNHHQRLRSLAWNGALNKALNTLKQCASNADFDKCLSIDGDSQGVERLYEALSAHMWPGMSLKSGNKIIDPSLPEQEDGPVTPISTTGTWKPSPSYLDSKNLDCKGEVRSVGEEHWPSTSASQLQEELDRDETPEADESDHTSDPE
ncbi:uncharacterized protein Fot_24326 [Forsythia ovata]|uniref:Uncharacterized protein n=1 Tax=Forsythia ovata TaxID=205694 RepID=A0ABD1U6K7_9LAMI